MIIRDAVGMSHFDRFNRGARAVLVRAQNEAIPRDHTLITPAHLLLGMAREPRGIAAKALRTLQLPEPALVLALDYGPEEWKHGRVGEIELGSRSKTILMAAVTAANDLNHPQVGTAHLLFGLGSEEAENGSGVLASLGMETETVCTEVLRLIEKRGPERDRWLLAVADPYTRSAAVQRAVARLLGQRGGT